MARGLTARQVFERCRQAGVNAGEGATVRLIHTMLAGVGRALGQGFHLGRHPHQARGQRQFSAQVVHLGQVMAQRHVRLSAQCVLQRLRSDVGVAVAVAANPLAHAQKAVHGVLAQFGFQVRIDLRDLAQESRFVIRQRVLDLIGHGELAVAQQARLPQLRHAGTQQGFVGGQFARGERVLGAVVKLRAHLDVIAHGQQLGDVALGVQNALALNFGGVGGEHGCHVAAGQRLRNRLGRNAGPAQARQGHFNAAFLRIARTFMHGAAADVVAVFRQVGQVTEIGEGADHAHRLVAREGLEQLLERAVGVLIGIAAESHRQLAHLLDQFVGLHPLLLTDHVAQNTPQQADIVNQGLVLVGSFHARGSPEMGKRCPISAATAIDTRHIKVTDAGAC